MSYLKNDEFIITRKELEEIESLKNNLRKCLDSAKANLKKMQIEIDRLKNNLHGTKVDIKIKEGDMYCGNCKHYIAKIDSDTFCLELNTFTEHDEYCERWKEI